MSKLEALRDAILAQNPTAEQQEAIFANELEFLLRAAPGSGKTWTSCRRFIWRGANWPHHCGGLALLSFTNSAIHEFKDAVADFGNRDLISDPNFVGTFDSFAERFIITPFGHLITGARRRPKLFPGPRPGDQNNRNLKAWMKSNTGGRERQIPVPAWEVIPYPGDEGEVLSFKTTRRFGSKSLDHHAGEPVKRLLSLGYYTHAQRAFWAYYLLHRRPHLASVVARRFPEIIVDEAQDTNAWLIHLLSLLRRQGTRITLVGDPDQCIYEFSLASASSLPDLKERWEVPERPLSKSFRCNNRIAESVRSVGGNPRFEGCGEGLDESCRSYVFRESSDSFTGSIEAFWKLTSRAKDGIRSSSILCRGHQQLQSIKGKANFLKLQGNTKSLAEAAFLRDSQRYREASQKVRQFLREVTGDDPLWDQVDDYPESAEAKALALSLWKLIKDPKKFPPVSTPGNDWLEKTKRNLSNFINEVGFDGDFPLGRLIRRSGLNPKQLSLPLIESEAEIPIPRRDTIHQVKGESIDAVLVLGSAKFWNAVVKAVENGKGTEERRLAYVAMTRARHQLVVSLPAKHFDKYEKTWTSWGFEILV